MGYQDREYFKSEFPHPDFTPPIKNNLPLQLGLGCFFLGLLHTFLSETPLSVLFDVSPDAIFQGRVWGLVLAPFAAQGWHIFIHGLMMYFFAKVCIGQDGVKRFLLYYTCLGFLAALLYYVVAASYGSFNHIAPEIWQLSLDGVIMVLAVRYPRMIVNLFGLLPIQIRYLVGAYVLFVVYNVVHITSGGGGGLLIAVTSSKVAVFVLAFVYAKFQRKIESKIASLKPNAVFTSTRVESMLSEMDDVAIRKEVDRILDKISEKSISSLTEDERQFLKKSSQKFKK